MMLGNNYLLPIFILKYWCCHSKTKPLGKWKISLLQGFRITSTCNVLNFFIDFIIRTVCDRLLDRLSPKIWCTIHGAQYLGPGQPRIMATAIVFPKISYSLLFYLVRLYLKAKLKPSNSFLACWYFIFHSDCYLQISVTGIWIRYSKELQ